MSALAFQRCIHPHCAATVDLGDTAFQCPKCGGLLDVAYDWNRLPVPKSLKHFESKWANRNDPTGSWRPSNAPPSCCTPSGCTATSAPKPAAITLSSYYLTTKLRSGESTSIRPEFRRNLFQGWGEHSL